MPFSLTSRPALARLPVVFSSLLLILGLAASDSHARVRWTTPGSYRFRMVGIDAFSLDNEGTANQRTFVGQHRLRIDPTIEAGPARFFIQLDVLTGQIFGAPNPVGARFVPRRRGDPEDVFNGWTTVEPRLLWGRVDTAIGRVTFGQMAANWGMGLLDNDGADRDESPWVETFGDSWNGDIVDRFVFEIQPAEPFTLSRLSEVRFGLGADHVYQDDQASFLDGDSAYRLFSTLYYPGEEVFAGLMLMYRTQDDRDGDRFEATWIDATVRWQAPFYRINAELKIEAEGVIQFGQTDRERPRAAVDGVDILAGGLAARADLAWRCPRVAIGLETGFATGDGDPQDGASRAFTFDPDHRVGFILFSETLRQISLRGAERLADAGRVGFPPAGVDEIPTDGGVRNAVYINPTVTWRPGASRLSLMALAAWSATPFQDPYETFGAGGEPRNHQGRIAERFYGVEAALSASHEFAVASKLPVSLGFQGGMLFTGSALGRRLSEAPVWKSVARLGLRW